MRQSEQGQSRKDGQFATQEQGTPGYQLDAQQAWQAYHDLAESTIRTARRVSEIMLVGQYRQALVQDITEQVMAAVRSELKKG